jgi:hypothetical protein
MKECVTHHHACDCREAQFAQLEAENAKLRKALTHIQRMSTVPIIKDIAETALAGGDE